MVNKNAKSGEKQAPGKNAGRKRVLVLAPRENKPTLLSARFKWADEL